MLIDTGSQSTISGSGKIYDAFQRTGIISGYSGGGGTPMKISDPNSDLAPLRKMEFDETYHGMTYKCTRSSYLYFYHCYVS